MLLSPRPASTITGIIAVAIAILSSTGSPHAQDTSCSSAADWAGEVICSDSRLTEKSHLLDRITGDLIAALPSAARPRMQVERAQWRFSLNGCKTVGEKDGITPRDCLLSLFDMRISELDQLLHTSINTGSNKSMQNAY